MTKFLCEDNGVEFVKRADGCTLMNLLDVNSVLLLGDGDATEKRERARAFGDGQAKKWIHSLVDLEEKKQFPYEAAPKKTRKTHWITYRGIQRMVMKYGEAYYPKKFGDRLLDNTIRLDAGAASIVAEAQRNAASNAPENCLAREDHCVLPGQMGCW